MNSKQGRQMGRTIIGSLLLALVVGPTMAEDRCVAVGVSGVDDEGALSTITFDAIGEPKETGEYLLFEGWAFTEFEEAPVTIRAERPAAQVVAAVQLEEIGFTQHRYTVAEGDVRLTRVVLIGQTERGEPSFVHLTDDPSPILPVLVIIGARVGFCGVGLVSYMVSECPGGSEMSIGGATLDCSFVCRE